MSNRIHALAQQLTGKTSIEECSLDEVRQIALRYPYFAPAQFLLAQKLKQTDSSEWELQQKKAVLFFHDPLLFDQFISSDNFYSDPVFVENETEVRPKVNEETEADLNNIDYSFNKEPVITGDPIESTDVIEEDQTNIDDEAEEIIPPQRDAYEEEKVNEEDVVAFLPERIQSTKTGDAPESFFAKEESSADVRANDVSLTATEKLPEENNNKPDVHPAPNSEFAFEPYHTVDYFASQGIKISQEDLEKDRLAKQLKSFTEWLKTMKRLPAVQMTGLVETVAEKKVERMANHSVTESDVVTEAMAEVWAKQGNKEKALDIYNKLVLLNPSKRAFFAAKIENLKTS